MKTKITFFVTLFFAFTVFTISNAQDISFKEKMEKIEGKIQKIIIQTENGETVFEGDEAIKLGKMLTFQKRHRALWHSKEENEFVVKNPNKKMIFVETDGEEGVEKEVNIKIEDSVKTVTVKTKKDGEETEEILTGEEAEKWLKEHEVSSDIDFEWVGEEEGEKHFIVKLDDDSETLLEELKSEEFQKQLKKIEENEKELEKTIEVEIDDDEDIIILKKIDKDGKETTKILNNKKLEEISEKDFNIETIEKDGEKTYIIKIKTDVEDGKQVKKIKKKIIIEKEKTEK